MDGIPQIEWKVSTASQDRQSSNQYPPCTKHMEAAHPTEVNPVRFTQLDSLRGVAACTVVLGHFWSGMGTAAYLGIWNSPLVSFVAGR